jgi:hypothetical protein
MFLNLLCLVSCILFVPCNLVAADSVNKTVEYQNDSSEETIVEPQCITSDELTADLKDFISVRYQIKANLALSQGYPNYPNDSLSSPVLCIGTGRNASQLIFRQQIPTQLRGLDISLDKNAQIDPHYHIADAFEIGNDIDTIADNSVGFVFFAHVGNTFLPIRKNYLHQSILTYKDKLTKHGLLIYNSEVHKEKEKITAFLAKIHDEASFESLTKSTIKLFTDAGFTNVELIIKDESAKYSPETLSFLVIAQKP